LLNKHDFGHILYVEKNTATKDGPRERFSLGEATHKTNRTPTEIVVDLIKIDNLLNYL
jgi:hypothetical protein